MGCSLAMPDSLPPVCPYLPAGNAAVALGPALQELLAPCFALLLEVTLPFQLLELQVLKQLGLHLQRLRLLRTHKGTADHPLWTDTSASRWQVSRREISCCAPTSCWCWPGTGTHGKACPQCPVWTGRRLSLLLGTSNMGDSSNLCLAGEGDGSTRHWPGQSRHPHETMSLLQPGGFTHPLETSRPS